MASEEFTHFPPGHSDVCTCLCVNNKCAGWGNHPTAPIGSKQKRKHQDSSRTISNRLKFHLLSLFTNSQRGQLVCICVQSTNKLRIPTSLKPGLNLHFSTMKQNPAAAVRETWHLIASNGTNSLKIWFLWERGWNRVTDTYNWIHCNQGRH